MTLWAWSESDESETWNGPFGSREEAEAEALKYPDDPAPVVAECKLISTPDVAAVVVNIDRVIDDMDEQLEWWDEPAFEPKEGAEEALEKAIRAWAAEYLETNVVFEVTGESLPVRAAEALEGKGE